MKHLNLILAIFLAAGTLAVRTECKGILLTAEGEKIKHFLNKDVKCPKANKEED
jgi:hypothetical protein